MKTTCTIATLVDYTFSCNATKSTPTRLHPQKARAQLKITHVILNMARTACKRTIHLHGRFSASFLKLENGFALQIDSNTGCTPEYTIMSWRDTLFFWDGELKGHLAAGVGRGFQFKGAWIGLSAPRPTTGDLGCVKSLYPFVLFEHFRPHPHPVYRTALTAVLRIAPVAFVHPPPPCSTRSIAPFLSKAHLRRPLQKRSYQRRLHLR